MVARTRSPVFSVMMPAYNAEETISRACSSLLLQGFEDWECIVVDDGSDDRTAAVVEEFQDARFKVVRLPENMGRGVARQVALERAQGKYLAFLDADDWWYPEKLEIQMDVLRTVPDVAVVSAGIAVVSPMGDIVGLIRADHTCGEKVRLDQWRRLDHHSIAFASSVIVGDVARKARFDPRLRRAQDFDFLVQVTYGKKYAVMPDVCYAYVRDGQDSVKTLRAAYRYGRLAMRKHWRLDPVGASRGILFSYLKSVGLVAAGLLGWEGYLVRKRYKQVPEVERERFIEARRRVFGAGLQRGAEF